MMVDESECFSFVFKILWFVPTSPVSVTPHAPTCLLLHEHHPTFRSLKPPCLYTMPCCCKCYSLCQKYFLSLSSWWPGTSTLSSNFTSSVKSYLNILPPRELAFLPCASIYLMHSHLSQYILRSLGWYIPSHLSILISCVYNVSQCSIDLFLKNFYCLN